jgi:hypothetical protein
MAPEEVGNLAHKYLEHLLMTAADGDVDMDLIKLPAEYGVVIPLLCSEPLHEDLLGAIKPSELVHDVWHEFGGSADGYYSWAMACMYIAESNRMEGQGPGWAEGRVYLEKFLTWLASWDPLEDLTCFRAHGVPCTRWTRLETVAKLSARYLGDQLSHRALYCLMGDAVHLNSGKMFNRVYALAQECCALALEAAHDERKCTVAQGNSAQLRGLARGWVLSCSDVELMEAFHWLRVAGLEVEPWVEGRDPNVLVQSILSVLEDQHERDMNDLSKALSSSPSLLLLYYLARGDFPSATDCVPSANSTVLQYYVKVLPKYEPSTEIMFRAVVPLLSRLRDLRREGVEGAGAAIVEVVSWIGTQ